MWDALSTAVKAAVWPLYAYYKYWKSVQVQPPTVGETEQPHKHIRQRTTFSVPGCIGRKYALEHGHGKEQRLVRRQACSHTFLWFKSSR